MKLDADRLYEIAADGIPLPATQALNEIGEEVTYLSFGDVKREKIISIDEACAKCNEWQQMNFKSIELCQVRQGEDAKLRGFTSLICPNQFITRE